MKQGEEVLLEVPSGGEDEDGGDRGDLGGGGS